MNKLFLHLLVIVLPVLAVAQKKDKPAPKVYDLVIGGYTKADGNKGITVYRFYAETGRTAYLSEVEIPNPTYLTVSPDRKFVYAGSEAREGSVSAFSFDYVSGSLKFINKQLSAGASPVHVTIDKDAKNVMVSNYGGTLSVLPVNKDGSLSPATQTIKGEGKGAHPQRQTGPHIHSLTFSPDEKYALYADLGTDKISIAKYKDNKVPAIATEDVAIENVKPGDGPRHMEFSPDGKFLYLVNELGGTINAYSYNKGKLTFIESLNMSPPAFTGTNAGADIHITPGGKFLYASNRGTANELLVYAVDQVSGKLTYATRYPTAAEPRNFVIEPGGRFLLLAAQKGNIVQIYSMNQQNGSLTPLNNPISITGPTVLKLVAAE